MVKIGKIRGPWGREGEVEIECYSPFPERFSKVGKIFIGEKVYKVEGVRFFPKKVVLKLEGINSIEEARKISYKEIEVPEEEIYNLPEDYYYLHELEGCNVYLKDGKKIGVVDYVWELGESTLLGISGERGEILVPFAKNICYSINTKEKRIEIDPPEGLLDLNEV